jgi:hypothetical protein
VVYSTETRAISSGATRPEVGARIPSRMSMLHPLRLIESRNHYGKTKLWLERFASRSL